MEKQVQENAHDISTSSIFILLILSKERKYRLSTVQRMQWLQTTWRNHWLERNLFILVSELWIHSEHPCPAGVCWRNYFRKEKSQYELHMYYILNRMKQKNMVLEYQRKLRIRKQSTSPVKPIILLKLLGMITIDYCYIVVPIYSLFGPWCVLTGNKKAIESFGMQFQQF